MGIDPENTKLAKTSRLAKLFCLATERWEEFRDYGNSEHSLRMFMADLELVAERLALVNERKDKAAGRTLAGHTDEVKHGDDLPDARAVGS